MVVITKLIMIGIAVVCVLTLTFIVLEFVADKVKSASSKKRNRVHFYVARDMDGGLYLYLGKPFRGDGEFYGNKDANAFTLTGNFRRFGLNKNDYKNLHWKDEPVEVFVNKSNENNTWFVDYKDIEEAFVAGAYFAFAYLVTSNNTEMRTEI